jgi:DNA-binding response OmpR family regulator
MNMHRSGMAKILVVEDDIDLLAVLRELLGSEHEVRTARRGEDAIAGVRAFGPDLVIVDLQLPSMDGIETGRWIKRELEPREVPILALTALSQAGDPEAILRSGCCDAYMSKPASIDSIRQRVAELLRGSEE